jgi:hypothetical protein
VATVPDARTHYQEAADWLARAETHHSNAGDVEAAHFAQAAAMIAQVHVMLGDRATREEVRGG